MSATAHDPRFAELSQVPVSFRLGSRQVQFLYWGFYPLSYWRNWLHVHTFYEICYAYAGEGLFRMEGHDLRVKAGDVFIARPDEAHEIISSRRKPLGIYFWAYSLSATSATGRNKEDVSTRGNHTDEIDKLLDAMAATTQWVSDRCPGMEQTLLLLSQEVLARRPGYVDAIAGLSRKLVLDTARAVAGDQVQSAPVDGPARSAAEAVVQRCVAYMRDNLARPIGVRDVAAQAAVSERHLGRLFTTVLGVPVLEHLLKLRIERATQLLLNPDLPIKQIAASVGYPDVHYFTTLFRRRTSQTPAAFRRTRGTTHLKRGE